MDRLACSIVVQNNTTVNQRENKKTSVALDIYATVLRCVKFKLTLKIAKIEFHQYSIICFQALNCTMVEFSASRSL